MREAPRQATSPFGGFSGPLANGGGGDPDPDDDGPGDGDDELLRDINANLRISVVDRRSLHQYQRSLTQRAVVADKRTLCQQINVGPSTSAFSKPQRFAQQTQAAAAHRERLAAREAGSQVAQAAEASLLQQVQLREQ